MMLTATPRSACSTGPPRPGPGPGSSAAPGFAALGAGSDRPEVQARIREAIRRGVVRVRPVPGCPDRVQVSAAPPDRP